MSFISRVLPTGMALALALVGITACPPPVPVEGEGEPDASCGSDRDCGGGSICDKVGDGDDIAPADDEAGVCLKIFCITDDDCADPVNEKCDTRRGICIPRNLCDPGNPLACPTAGEKCIYENGLPVCTAPPAATACTLSPSPAYISGGETLQVEGVGNDDAGKLVAQTSFVWSTSAGTIDATSGVLTAPASGTVTVTGTTNNGGSVCTTTVNVYAVPAATDLRIVVIDQASHLPLGGVKVAAKIAGLTVSQTTDATGASTFFGGAVADAHGRGLVHHQQRDVVQIVAGFLHQPRPRQPRHQHRERHRPQPSPPRSAPKPEDHQCDSKGADRPHQQWVDQRVKTQRGEGEIGAHGKEERCRVRGRCREN